MFRDEIPHQFAFLFDDGPRERFQEFVFDLIRDRLVDLLLDKCIPQVQVSVRVQFVQTVLFIFELLKRAPPNHDVIFGPVLIGIEPFRLPSNR